MTTELYSIRLKRSEGRFPDTYQYKSIPIPLRNQALYIFEDFFSNADGAVSYSDCSLYDKRDGNPDDYEEGTYGIYGDRFYGKKEIYENITALLCREYGLPVGVDTWDAKEFITQLFADTKAPTEKIIDIIELLFQYIENTQCFFDEDYEGRQEDEDKLRTQFESYRQESLSLLNRRFRERGVGYCYESNQIIRVDNQHIHSKVIRPAINLISDPMFKTTNKEFLSAHEHYRKGNYKPCLIECSNAFESTLKIICESNGWKCDRKKPASKDLLDTVYKNNLLPVHARSFFDSVRGGLEHGIPSIRNNMAGHGQGTKEVDVPDFMAEYMINITSSAILLLIKAHNGIRQG